jgi:hypothetical protein
MHLEDISFTCKGWVLQGGNFTDNFRPLCGNEIIDF